MTLHALDALAADPATELIMVISKPPGRAVRERVANKLGDLGKPVVVAMLGRGIEPGAEGNVTTVVTLEDAAVATIAARGGPRGRAPSAPPAADLKRRVAQARRELRPTQHALRALYAGGTLAQEALLVLGPLLGPISSNLEPGANSAHRILDLGADEFTVGRAHPMLDPSSRIEAIERAGKESDVAVLLLDVLLGHGVARDPAGDIAPALEAARAGARAQGRGLTVVATVVGTADDPQGLAGQIERLEAAGAWVLPSNAQAARMAACVVGGERVMNAVLGADG
jgi:FdrA protein